MELLIYLSYIMSFLKWRPLGSLIQISNCEIKITILIADRTRLRSSFKIEDRVRLEKILNFPFYKNSVKPIFKFFLLEYSNNFHSISDIKNNFRFRNWIFFRQIDLHCLFGKYWPGDNKDRRKLITSAEIEAKIDIGETSVVQNYFYTSVPWSKIISSLG